MQIAHKTYPHLNAPVGPFVHAVSYNGLLFLSGLTAFKTPGYVKHKVLKALTAAANRWFCSIKLMCPPGFKVTSSACGN